MATISDIIEGNSGRLTIKGWEFNRIYKITDLQASGEAMLVEAVQNTGVAFGDPHPAVPTAFAIEFDPSSIPSTGNAATVNILYREYSQDYETSIGVRRQPVTTPNFFSNPNSFSGNPQKMELFYEYPGTPVLGEENYQGVELEIDEWLDTFTVSRTEFTTISADTLSGHPIGVKLTGAILTDRMRQFNNTVNFSNWNLRPNDQEWTWKLAMSAESAENGLAYRVKYQFSYDPNQWRYPATFISQRTGQPVTDPIEYDPTGGSSGTDDTLYGFRNFPQFLAQDFSLLELV